MSTVTKVKKILSDAIINRKKQKEKDYLYRLYNKKYVQLYKQTARN